MRTDIPFGNKESVGTTENAILMNVYKGLEEEVCSRCYPDC